MWRVKVTNANFKEEGYCECVFEDCPKCKNKNLRYPIKWKHAVPCPDCGHILGGKALLKQRWSRQHYYHVLKCSTIGKILLCTE